MNYAIESILAGTNIFCVVKYSCISYTNLFLHEVKRGKYYFSVLQIDRLQSMYGCPSQWVKVVTYIKATMYNYFLSWKLDIVYFYFSTSGNWTKGWVTVTVRRYVLMFVWKGVHRNITRYSIVYRFTIHHKFATNFYVLFPPVFISFTVNWCQFRR